MFSSRLPDRLAPNRLAQLLAEARPQIDLTMTNPTQVGLDYPAGLLDSLAAPRGLRYDPHPLGLAEAREAVAAEYLPRGVKTSPDRIVMTASTSEAYGLLFKLLCDPGDQILVPRPSYPLVEHLAGLESVVMVPYELEYAGRWSVDLEPLERAVTPRTRAVVVVSPNNPTGSVLTDDELVRIVALCRARGLALIADEVFIDYPLNAGAADEPTGPQSVPSVLRNPGALVFALGGLSKSVGLPQVKLAWMVVDGPLPLVEDALARLEVVCDAYLSAATPVQLAAPKLLQDGARVREQIRARVLGNHEHLSRQVAGHPACDLLAADAGWSAVVRVPAVIGEEALAIELLTQAEVLVHPGYFFDFAHEAFVVVSLLPRPADFAVGIGRVLEHVNRHVTGLEPRPVIRGTDSGAVGVRATDS